MLVQSIDLSSQMNSQLFSFQGSSTVERAEFVFERSNYVYPSQVQWFLIPPVTVDAGDVKTSFATGTTGVNAPSIWFNEISLPERQFVLSQYLTPRLYCEDSMWYCESESLGILAFGQSREEAICSFLQDFSALWDGVAQIPDESLTADALDVKRTFLRIVKDVRQV
jgi:hypothetical protein